MRFLQPHEVNVDDLAEEALNVALLYADPSCGRSSVRAESPRPARTSCNPAICLQPLTPRQVDDYLEQFGAELGALRIALKKDHVLQEMAQSPLMLSVITLVYQGASPDAPIREANEAPEASRTGIFETYVSKMLKRKGNSGYEYTNGQMERWLSWLAHRMKSDGQSIS